jgi:hypothetical protein
MGSSSRLTHRVGMKLVASPNLHSEPANAKGINTCRPNDDCVLAPELNQEIWATGVTYYCSRDARIVVLTWKI